MVPFWIMETLNNPGFRWKILDSWTFSAKTAMDQYFLIYCKYIIPCYRKKIKRFFIVRAKKVTAAP